MAFVTLNVGDEIALGAGTHVIDGTGKVTFSSANTQATYAGSGANVDTIRLSGSTTDYMVRKDGTQLILTHVLNGKSIAIASGTTADTVLFSDASLLLQ